MQKSIHTHEYERFLSLLRAERRKAGLSQHELGKLLDMSQSDISKWERGERRIDVIELWQWCGALGISLRLFSDRLERAIGPATK